MKTIVWNKKSGKLDMKFQFSQHLQQQYFIPTYWIEQLKIAKKKSSINRYLKFNSNTCIVKNYKSFPFEERKSYEDTFVEIKKVGL